MVLKLRYISLLPILLALAAPAAYSADPLEGLARTCNNCHGDGSSAGGSMPSIGGQSESYLKNVLMQWKTGERYSATMGRLIKGYSDEELAGLAHYFSQQPWTPVAQRLNADLVKKGKGKATAICAACHGATGSEPADDETPKLNGQTAQYMEMELMKYRDASLTMPHKAMRKIAMKLTEEDVAAISEYYASQAK
ncbi:MAG TPA: c-type cytochrome [Thiobacillaceae bacterium]|nr:c-type cytochrome [Thiobacillaceae bacterium]